MLSTLRLTALAATALGLAGITLAGQPPAAPAARAGAAPLPNEPIKDRAAFIPARKHQILKGTAIGVLAYDGQPVLSTEGRSGPADQLCFGADGCSYRWVYVPTFDKAQITNLRVPVGEKENDKFQVFPSLDLARPRNVTPWGVTAQYSLVEVEVNSGLGSPKNDSFVATRMNVLDGSKEYPLRVSEVIKQLKGRYAAYQKEQKQVIDAAMTAAQKKALKDEKATGPREQAELMYVTWMTDTKRLRVHFRTKISDGAYRLVGGGAQPCDPVPLPVKRQAPGKLPPPPPRLENVRVGTTFGVEFGMAYEVDHAGKLVRTQSLPIESFESQLAPPPGIRPGGPVPLPVPRPLPVKD
ncbi:MAG: hypothetical protein L0Z62_16290 [Gemmataceae bacterium]|nr:hypothetical protein [Gemmataceae bacterium]